MKTIRVTDNCYIVIRHNGITIGDNMRMDGMDSPAYLTWEEIKLLIEKINLLSHDNTVIT